MTKKGIWLLASIFVVIAMLLVSCGTPKEPTTSPTTTPTTTASTTTAKPTTPATITPITTTQPTTAATTAKPTTKAPQYGGEIRVKIFRREAVGSWDPQDMDMLSIYPLDLIYERLGIGDWTKAGSGTGEFMFGHFSWYPPEYAKPNILEKWEMPDALTAIFTLRKGVRWHNKPPVNGREMTADDIKFSLDRLAKSKAPGAWVPYYVGTTVKDKYTVEVKFKSPYYDILREVAYGGYSWMHPQEVVNTYGDLRDWKNAIGTGPFILKDYVASSSVTFVKNTEYWNYDELNPKNKLPYVDVVKELLFSDDAAQMAAMRTGKLDLVFAVPYDKHKTLKATAPSMKSYGMAESSRNPMFMFRVDEAPFNDLKVRQAMQMGVNFQEIIDSWFDGNGIYRGHPIMPIWGSYYIQDKDLPADVKELFSYNPTKAKQLLKEAGFPNGFKTTIVTQPSFIDQSTVFAEYWKKIGLDVQLQVLEATAFLGYVYAGNAHGIIAKGSGISGPVWAIQYFKTGGRFNNGGFSDKNYDAFIEKMETTTDQAELLKLVKEGTLLYYRTVPCLAFPLGTIYNYWQPWVGNYKGEYSIGGAMGAYVMLSRLWVDQDLKKSMGY